MASKRKLEYLFDTKAIKTFADVPEFISSSSTLWSAHYPWSSIGEWMDSKTVILEPDFQRGRCWTREQQVAYIEFCLRGGTTGHDILFNQTGDLHMGKTPYVLVDGLQRLTAIQAFMSDSLKVFNSLTCSEMIKNSRNKKFPWSFSGTQVSIKVNNLQTETEVLAWYLELNGGGTPHSEEELDRVYKLYKKSLKTAAAKPKK